MIKRGDKKYVYFTKKEYEKIQLENIAERERLKRDGLEYIYDNNLRNRQKKYDENKNYTKKLNADRVEEMKNTYRSMSREELESKHNEMLSNRKEFIEEAFIAIEDILKETK